MKTKNFILSVILLFIGTVLFTGCSTQKNYNMSYEQVISLLENQSKEMMEMFFNVGAQEKQVQISTNLDTDEVKFNADIQSQSKIDYDSKMQDMSLSFDADVKIPKSELDFSTSGAVDYSLIWDDMYLKLSKFSLRWPSAKDLMMVTMVVNGLKWKWFKLGMTGVSMSRTFDLYNLYNEKLWDIVNNAWDAMINQGSWIYDWMFEEYKGYNAWKYSIDKEKFDEMLYMYVDMMNEFYSWLFAQYAENLWKTDEELSFLDFNDVLSGITYDELKWYFIIVWKNEVVETMEDAHMNIDGTWVVCNYYYGKDGLYFEIKTDDWEDMMLFVAKRNWRAYTIYASINSMLWIKWDIIFNQFSKKSWIDADFDLILTVNVEPEVLADDSDDESGLWKGINIQMPFKWNYKVKNISKFSLQEPEDAVDLMEMLGGFMWSVDEESLDDYELGDTYEFEDTSLELE